MNVAALLQDSPSEDTTNRRRHPDNRAWPTPSSPSLQQQPSSTPTSSWAPGIQDRTSPHWQERDRRLSNPTLVGPGTGVPPSPYIHPDEKTPRSPSHSQPRSDPSRRTSGDADHVVMRENRQRADGPPPPGFYSGPQRDRDREREQRDRADMDIIRAVASSRPTPSSHTHHHVHNNHSHQQQHTHQHPQHQHVHTHSSGPVPLIQPTQPQKQFQHQFHTQFVPGLTVGNGSPSRGNARSSSVIHGSQQQQQGQSQPQYHGHTQCQHGQSQPQSHHHQQHHPNSHSHHSDSTIIDVEDHNPPMMGLPPPSHHHHHHHHHQQQQMQEMHRRQGSHSHHLVGYGGDGRERERALDRDRDRGLDRDRDRGVDRDKDRGVDRDKDRGVDRDRERDRGMERDRERDRETERERDRGRERDRDVDMLDASSGQHARQQGIIVVDEARGDEGWYSGAGPGGGGGTEYSGPPGLDHRHGMPQHHSNQHQQQLLQRKEYEGQPLIVNNAPSHSNVAIAPSGHLRIPVHDSELDTPVSQNVGTAGPGPGPGPSPGSAGLGPGGNDNPPGINPSSTLIDDWDLDIAIEEEGRSWNRARVGVYLGTFVFPRLPFPYFFELGSGLVGAKEREEEKERTEKEREENEMREREKEEKEREKAERDKEKEKKKVNGEKQKEDDNVAMKIEEGEIIEKGLDEKEVDRTSDIEKKDRGIEIQLPKDDSKDLSISIQGKIHSPLSIQPQQDPQLPQPSLLDIETRTTIIIPTGHIPVEKPLRPRLWGGGGFDPRPRPPPLRTRRSKNGGLNGKGRHQQQQQLQSRPSSTKPSLLSASANTSLNSSSSSNSNNPALPTSKPQIRTRRPRRIYTDDSDIFLCAIHSGWVTWSGARKARLKGRDMRVEVRIMRCAGVGRGIENLGDSSEGESERVKEEMIGRFVGGYGERCFNPLGKSGRVAGEEGSGGGDGGEEEEEEEGGLMLDDPDDDGRSLVSAAWGSGHDGSAIEILNVEFVEKGTARSACGLGRRNRSQRLLEYAERRASVLGHPCTPTFGRLAGRKRRRGWDACSWPVHHSRRLPNATVLDVIQEVEGEEEEDANVHCVKGLRVQEEDRLMDVRTMVFGMGVSGDLRIGYKYVPNVLKEILFPSPRSSSSDQPPPRKRRRTQENEDLEMENADNQVVLTSFVPQSGGDTLRPVVLDTLKESYLLSPSIPLSTSSVDARQTYDIALILEAEVVVEEEPLLESERNAALEGNNDTTKHVQPIDGPSTTEKTEPTVPSQIVAPSKTSDLVRDKQVEPFSSPPTDSLTLEDETAKPQFAVQVLQRNLTRDMFRFVDEGVYVKEDGGGGSMETEWVIQVKDWKWAPKERI